MWSSLGKYDKVDDKVWWSMAEYAESVCWSAIKYGKVAEKVW